MSFTPCGVLMTRQQPRFFSTLISADIESRHLLSSAASLKVLGATSSGTLSSLSPPDTLTVLWLLSLALPDVLGTPDTLRLPSVKGLLRDCDTPLVPSDCLVPQKHSPVTTHCSTRAQFDFSCPAWLADLLLKFGDSTCGSRIFQYHFDDSFRPDCWG